jgi:aspartate/methionine/tyrosine aminotransferase
MNIDTLISHRAGSINGSGIRKVFDLGAKLKDPVNLSIGQPDFPVPRSIKDAAIRAIEEDRNGYTPTKGIPQLLGPLSAHIRTDLGWETEGERPDAGLMVTSGTSGGLVLACMALLNPGDEIIIPDPWFVLYPHMAELCGAKAVPCDTYPDFRMTAERVAPLITPRTKAVLLCSPSNPAGVVTPKKECAELLELCRSKGIVLISDEIYEEFAFAETCTDHMTRDPSRKRCPSPARVPGACENCLVIRGFGKSYGVTGWRLGYATGPSALIAEMIKLQQYMYVCAPTPLQFGAAAALSEDLSPMVADYAHRRDLVMSKLGSHTEVAYPGGAFYAFVKVPERKGISSTRFFELALERNVLIVPGKTFSSRDTHFRISYATPMAKLEQGLEALGAMLRD